MGFNDVQWGCSGIIWDIQLTDVYKYAGSQNFNFEQAHDDPLDSNGNPIFKPGKTHQSGTDPTENEQHKHRPIELAV